MATKIKISIPQPCHENWQEMTVADKGRFCTACQKKVFDFTYATDREIINAFEQNQNLCGRFLYSQLNRDLVKPKEKSSLWLAATSALVGFIGLGTHEATAQEPVKTEQTDKKTLSDSIKLSSDEFEVSGIVYDDENSPLPGANVIIKGTKKGVLTDFNGNFKINVKIGDVIIFSSLGFETLEKKINNSESHIIYMKSDNAQLEEVITGGAHSLRYTLIGRIFHSIGNWFK